MAAALIHQLCSATGKRAILALTPCLTLAAKHPWNLYENCEHQGNMAGQGLLHTKITILGSIKFKLKNPLSFKMMKMYIWWR